MEGGSSSIRPQPGSIQVQSTKQIPGAGSAIEIRGSRRFVSASLQVASAERARCCWASVPNAEHASTWCGHWIGEGREIAPTAGPDESLLIEWSCRPEDVNVAVGRCGSHSGDTKQVVEGQSTSA